MAEAETPRRPTGWVLPAVLLAVYLLIKVQAWAFAHGARTLERQLEELRPTLSARALSERLKSTVKAYEEGIQQIQEQNLPAPKLLRTLSELPPSIVLERLELRRHPGLRVSGSLLAGVRPPETVLVPWAQTLRDLGSRVRILRIVPSPNEPGLRPYGPPPAPSSRRLGEIGPEGLRPYGPIGPEGLRPYGPIGPEGRWEFELQVEA